MTRQLLVLELNEVNFEFLTSYIRLGQLPNFAALIARHGIQQTTSEHRYEQIEPWIQWVTAHTGLTLAQHGVSRLGDIVSKDLPQIWEVLEEKGLRVGAISPMNAKHRLRSPAFFVPDPWTSTNITASPTLRSLYAAIAQAVNDNAQSKVSVASVVALLRGLIRYARLGNYGRYLQMLRCAAVSPWPKAMFLDLLLSDVFIRELKVTRPDFATLFLNAGAHIQHHYMFCSESYKGSRRNPTWYVPPGVDPVREVYELYDRILGTIRSSFPTARIMLATGLHQVPHPEVTYYWRLKNHGAFLRRIGVEFATAEPRMSRDFLITCTTVEGARAAAERLQNAVAADGIPLFEVDNRGRDLFVMLTYPRDITRDFEFTITNERFLGFHKDVAFVALKNGKHSGIGYFLDTGVSKADSSSEFPLTEIPSRILRALGLHDSGALASVREAVS